MIRSRAGGMGLVLASLCCSAAMAQTSGTDVIVGDLPDFSNNSPTTINGISYDSFAVGTTSCNKGTAVLAWTTGGTDNKHPAISQNLFRLRDGKFEQLGQGWLKHGFTALQGTICSTQFGYGCTANPTGAALGVGCSDPYSSGLNNVSGGANLGPKWQVNAATGLFPYPFYNYSPATGPAVTYTTAGGTTPSGLIGPPRVRLSELNTYVSTDRYFMDAQYVAGDDAAATTGGFSNKFNNASWREVTLTPTGTPPAATNFAIGGTGSTTRELPAIYAWAAIDSTVTTTTYDVPGDGRFILACKVSGTGPYLYEYALYNLNSHRCAGSFTVPLPASHPALTAIGFHDCEVVGEPNALADPNNPASDDWAVSGGGLNATSIGWSGPAYAGTPPVYTTSGFSVTGYTQGTGNDHTANVLRWGTMFNYRFTSTLAPANGTVAIGLWRPGTPTTIYMTVRTPGGALMSGSSLTASCCVGTVCSVTTQASCTGTWGTPGSTCSPTDPCDTGSCCHIVGSTGNCTITASYSCNTGTFTQNGVCSPNPCPSTPGICCNGTTCTFVGQSSCTGTWTTGSSCSGNPCDPSGACCVAGSCAITIRSACSGSHTAGTTSCSGFVCPSGNDSCSSAVALCASTPVTSTTVGATYSASEGVASCGSSTTTPDVWYSYTPATAATLVIDTCGASTAYDTVLSVHTGSCGSLTQVACNDDDNTVCTSNRSRISFAGAAGTRYLIRVSGWNGATGIFTLTVTGGGGQGCTATGACCTGTTCTTVVQSACTSPGTWVGGTCTTSTCNPTGACCSGTTCLSVTQSSCTAPAVWVGGTCTTNLCDPTGSCCNDSVCTVVNQSACTLTFGVGGACTTNPCNPSGRCCSAGVCNITLQHGCIGTFTVGIASCTPNTCPPLSDNCNDRAGIPIGSTPFDTTNATTDGPAHASCQQSGTTDQQVGNDVWFNHPCQFTGTLDIDTCGSTFDTKLAVYNGYGCADFETRLMACNDDNTAATPTGCGAGTLQSKITINVVCGEHYTIRVGGFNGAVGTGVLTLTAHPAAQGACCDASGACVLTYQTCCTTTWNGGASCSAPNPCPQPTGACCTGTVCTLVVQAACTGSFKGVGTPCQGAPNPTTCCAANFNQTGGLTVQDIFDFLNAWFAGSATADFNGGGLTVSDIFDYLNAWFAGC